MSQELTQLDQTLTRRSLKFELTSNFYRLNHRPVKVYHYLFEAHTKLNRTELSHLRKLRMRERFWRIVEDPVYAAIFPYGKRGLVFDDVLHVFSAFKFQNFEEDPETHEMVKKFYSFSRKDPDNPHTILTLTYQKEFTVNANEGLLEDTWLFLQTVLTQCFRVPEKDLEQNPWFGSTTNYIHLPIHGNYAPKAVSNDLSFYIYNALGVNLKQTKDLKLIFNAALINKVVKGLPMDFLEFYVFKMTGREQDIRRHLNKESVIRDAYQFSEWMKDVKVCTKYPPVRHYKFLDLSRNNARNTSFKDHEGNVVTVEHYFKARYGIDLEYPRMQLAQLEGKKGFEDIYIPLELLKVSLRPTVIRNVNHSLLPQICRAATRDPREYFTITSDMVKCSGMKDQRNQPAAMKDFGLSMENEQTLRMIRVPAQTLPKVISSAKSQPIYKQLDAWKVDPSSRDSRHNGGTIHVYPMYWGENYRNNRNVVKAFLDNLTATHELRLYVHHLDDFSSQSSFIRFLKDFIKHKSPPHTSGSPPKVQKDVHLVLCILERKILGRDTIYEQIKCVADPSVPTQCIVVPTLKKNQRSVVQNIIALINTRLGGQTKVIIPLGPRDRPDDMPSNAVFDHFVKKKTMFIGITSCKFQESDRKPSILAMAYSMDPNGSVYAAQHEFQQGMVDYFDNFWLCFYNAMVGHSDEIGEQPSTIFVMRSGLSDSVVNAVTSSEIQAINFACEQFQQNYELTDWKPQICYMTVSRGHSTRFYDHKTTLNPAQGTVVEDGITETEAEFYLYSHEGKLGTSKPGFYKCYSNSLDENITLSMVQVVCYALCHLVGRSPFVTATPAPVYYASLLMDRCRLYTRNSHDPASEFTLERFKDEMKRLTFFT